jgi:hypothetical protein
MGLRLVSDLPLYIRATFLPSSPPLTFYYFVYFAPCIYFTFLYILFLFLFIFSHPPFPPTFPPPPISALFIAVARRQRPPRLHPTAPDPGVNSLYKNQFFHAVLILPWRWSQHVLWSVSNSETVWCVSSDSDLFVKAVRTWISSKIQFGTQLIEN